jgi:alpha-L-fucosidase
VYLITITSTSFTMKVFKTKIYVLAIFLGLFSMRLQAQTDSIAPGIFQGNWNSFINNYQFPEWFRDAKFGIWAHWTAQCVPEQGDWYARQMYMQGWGQYNSHVSRYGHPTTFGFMEIDNLWKAQNWNPEELMQLYQYAGAKYFVALANHHDNFDNYNSKFHQWNSVNVGPKKDIVGTWKALADKYGMRFGVSNHSSHAWHWFQTAYGYDPTGARAGQRYDAYTLTKAQGAGKWWNGLDPQELYTGICSNLKMPDGLTTTAATDDWHQRYDRSWNESIPACNPTFADKWYKRCQDLVDKYKPDLLYFDNFGLPLQQKGLNITAHFYNASKIWNGTNQAIVTAKTISGTQPKGVTLDIERGFSTNIQPYPWQSETCIGDWHYNVNTFNRHTYKSVRQVVRALVDIVSKNGNFLLNIPLKGDGTIDSDERTFLKGLGDWMQMNGGAIYKTRPWVKFGEGPTQVAEGLFSESALPFTSSDFRFVQKGDTLFVFGFEWPSNRQFVINSLGTNSTNTYASEKDKEVKSIQLFGHNGTITWNRTATALAINLPTTAPGNHAYAFKILFQNKNIVAQTPFSGIPWPIPGRIQAEEYDNGGEGIALHEANANGNQGGASYRNDQVDIETTQDASGAYNVAYALNGEWLEYTVNVSSTGKFDLDLRMAADGTGKTLHVEMDGVNISGAISVPNTAGWQTWQTVTVPNLNLTQGQRVMRIVFDSDYMNLNWVEFKKSTITSIEEAAKYEFAAFPNPFGTDGLKIATSNPYTYRITDMSGIVLEEGQGYDGKTVGTELNTGVYLLNLENNNGNFVKKIIRR